MFAAHEVGDHWVQRHHEAIGKGAPGWRGRALCARHVTTLTATKAVALVAAARFGGLRVRPRAVVAALAVDAISHYWADRRSTLAALAERTGKTDFYELGDGKASPCGTGAYALDQSWHVSWLFVAALIVAADSAEQ